MNIFLVSTALVLLGLSAASNAQVPNSFPNWEIVNRCTTIPGQYSPGVSLEACTTKETLARDQLRQTWAKIPVRVINFCTGPNLEQQIRNHLSYVALKDCVYSQPSMQIAAAPWINGRQPFPIFDMEARCRTMGPAYTQAQRDACSPAEQSGHDWLVASWPTAPIQSINWCMGEGMAENIGPPSYANLAQCIQYREKTDAQERPSPMAVRTPASKLASGLKSLFGGH